MAAARTVGIILVVIGIVALVWGGISWTREKTVLDVGPFKATAETREKPGCSARTWRRATARKPNEGKGRTSRGAAAAG